MSLKQDILALQGDYASLEKILRTACSLLELSNTKVINSSIIQDSVRIFFSGPKVIKCMNDACNNINNHISNPRGKIPNYEKFKNKIREITCQYNIYKFTTGAILYLDAIYDNISGHQTEEITFSQNYSGDYFIRVCIILLSNTQKTVLRDKIFIFACKILYPIGPISLNWERPITKENLKNIIQQYSSHAKFVDSFYNNLIYNFSILSL